MDHLRWEKVAWDADGEDYGPIQPVRDGTRHAMARVLRRVHKPRKRTFWGNQNGGVSSTRSAAAV